MEEKAVQSEAVKALYRQSALARKNGTADMTLEEINAEIAAARADMAQGEDVLIMDGGKAVAKLVAATGTEQR